MKAIILLSAFLFVHSITHAQKIETYYDYNWKICELPNARFYSVIEPADSEWQRKDYYLRERMLQMKGLYKDKDCKIKNGFFTFYHTNGRPSSLGLYTDNKKQGLWLYYHNNGMMRDSTVYDNDKPVGTGLGWFPNGSMSDSNVYNPDGTAVKVNWFDNGQLSSAGREVNNKQNGKWLYYNRNGKLSATEVYDLGKIISRVYYSEDGAALSDTADRDREAVCKKNFIAYLSNNLYFPPNIKITNGDKAMVLVNFTIDEEGKVVDAYVSSSFHPIIDQAALDVIRNSPQWIPAIDHNRLVKAYRRQPLTFLQEQ